MASAGEGQDTLISALQSSTQPPPKKHDYKTSADLERVTDYEEEEEISTMDIGNVSKSPGVLSFHI